MIGSQTVPNIGRTDPGGQEPGYIPAHGPIESHQIRSISFPNAQTLSLPGALIVQGPKPLRRPGGGFPFGPSEAEAIPGTDGGSRRIGESGTSGIGGDPVREG